MSDNQTAAADAPPAVRVIESKKKRRCKVSRRLRDVEKMERHLSRAAQRTARAVAEGVDAYRKRRRRSAAKKRDGALRDLPKNSAEGMAETMRIASRVPVDLARAADTPMVRRAFYLGTRMMMLPLGR